MALENWQMLYVSVQYGCRCVATAPTPSMDRIWSHGTLRVPHSVFIFRTRTALLNFLLADEIFVAMGSF
eukprot:scaffold6200_cov118-Cylindrotheca_fusiformis.AAC.5